METESQAIGEFTKQFEEFRSAQMEVNRDIHANIKEMKCDLRTLNEKVNEMKEMIMKAYERKTGLCIDCGEKVTPDHNQLMHMRTQTVIAEGEGMSSVEKEIHLPKIIESFPVEPLRTPCITINMNGDSVTDHTSYSGMPLHSSIQFVNPPVKRMDEGRQRLVNGNGKNDACQVFDKMSLNAQPHESDPSSLILPRAPPIPLQPPDPPDSSRFGQIYFCLQKKIYPMITWFDPQAKANIFNKTSSSTKNMEALKSLIGIMNRMSMTKETKKCRNIKPTKRRPRSKPDEWMLLDKELDELSQIHLAMVGHVDSGKSTLSGRLLHLLGRISQKQMHTYEKEAKLQAKGSFTYALAVDAKVEDRKHGITMTVVVAYFNPKICHAILLGSHGHKDFVPNMIAGATQASAALEAKGNVKSMVVGGEHFCLELRADIKANTTEVTLKDRKTLKADIMTVGVGARTVISHFKDQVEEDKGGLKIDAFFKTSVPDVYTNGDIATFPMKLHNGMRHVEHVEYACKSVEHAVKAIEAAEEGQLYGDNVGDPLEVSDERVVIIISAHENIKSRYSHVQNVWALVYERSVHYDIEKGRLPGFHRGALVKSKLQFVYSLIGNGNREAMTTTCVSVHIQVGDQILNGISENEMEKICKVGARYVEGPTMIVIALKCLHVEAADVNAYVHRINVWHNDQIPIYEPDLEAIVKKRGDKNLFISIDVVKHVKEAGQAYILSEVEDVVGESESGAVYTLYSAVEAGMSRSFIDVDDILKIPWKSRNCNYNFQKLMDNHSSFHP